MGAKVLDFYAHNKKIAKLRGETWKRALRQAKLDETYKPSVIRVLRVRKNLSQLEVKKRLGIKHQTTYARIERGESLITKDQATKIARLLSVSLIQAFRKEPEGYRAR